MQFKQLLTTKSFFWERFGANAAIFPFLVQLLDKLNQYGGPYKEFAYILWLLLLASDTQHIFSKTPRFFNKQIRESKNKQNILNGRVINILIESQLEEEKSINALLTEPQSKDGSDLTISDYLLAVLTVLTTNNTRPIPESEPETGEEAFSHFALLMPSNVVEELISILAALDIGILPQSVPLPEDQQVFSLPDDTGLLILDKRLLSQKWPKHLDFVGTLWDSVISNTKLSKLDSFVYKKPPKDDRGYEEREGKLANTLNSQELLAAGIAYQLQQMLDTLPYEFEIKPPAYIQIEETLADKISPRFVMYFKYLLFLISCLIITYWDEIEIPDVADQPPSFTQGYDHGIQEGFSNLFEARLTSEPLHRNRPEGPRTYITPSADVSLLWEVINSEGLPLSNYMVDVVYTGIDDELNMTMLSDRGWYSGDKLQVQLKDSATFSLRALVKVPLGETISRIPLPIGTFATDVRLINNTQSLTAELVYDEFGITSGVKFLNSGYSDQVVEVIVEALQVESYYIPDDFRPNIEISDSQKSAVIAALLQMAGDTTADQFDIMRALQRMSYSIDAQYIAPIMTQTDMAAFISIISQTQVAMCTPANMAYWIASELLVDQDPAQGHARLLASGHATDGLATNGANAHMFSLEVVPVPGQDERYQLAVEDATPAGSVLNDLATQQLIEAMGVTVIDSQIYEEIVAEVEEYANEYYQQEGDLINKLSLLTAVFLFIIWVGPLAWKEFRRKQKVKELSNQDTFQLSNKKNKLKGLFSWVKQKVAIEKEDELLNQESLSDILRAQCFLMIINRLEINSTVVYQELDKFLLTFKRNPSAVINAHKAMHGNDGEIELIFSKASVGTLRNKIEEVIQIANNSNNQQFRELFQSMLELLESFAEES